MTRRRLVHLLLALSAGWFVAAELHKTVAPGLPAALVSSGAIIGAQLLAALLVLARAPTTRGWERRGWCLLGGALLCWWSGNLFWQLAGDDEVPIPSWGDAGFLAFVPLAFAGLLALARAHVPHVPRALWLDGVVAALAAAAASAALVFDRVVAGASGTPLAVATNLAYPVGDLALLAVIVGTIALRGWRLDLTWGLLAAALVAFWGADTLYLVTTAEGTYAVGAWFDLGWYLATLLFAAAAWLGPCAQPRAADGTTTGTARLAVLPASFALLSLGLLVWDGLGTIAVALAATSLLVVLVRLVDANRTNASLLRAAAAEARTDPLTGLGNRRALLADLDAVLRPGPDAQEHTLALFDLDGFKAYNDTFGHAAGDALLARLGHALQATVLPGTAYRLGGDEFCVLCPLAGPQAERVVTAAVHALSEVGEGFTVTASHGTATLPVEAHEPLAALQLVDQRMYAGKTRHRARTARLESHDVLIGVLDECEPDLNGHARRVADRARLVGRHLGLDAEALDELGRAAELHDIGKTAIPDAILGKPGPLTDDEWRIVHQHSVVGERIIARAPALRPVAALVRASHERWDGRGYPDGLRGEEIPLGARIVAVCDAADALMSDRPYRPAQDLPTALAELRRCAGTQFDPRVVDALVATTRAPAEHPALRAEAR